MDNSQAAAAIFNKYAVEYQTKFMDTSLYHQSFNLFCSSIKKPNAVILEIACGPGNITHYLLKKRPDFKIMGIDLSPNMIELAKINNPTATFEIMDGRNIHKIPEKYDGIMCGFCLPYLIKEEALNLISNATKLLNKNGVLYISTMEDDYNKSGLKAGSKGDLIYMNYHQADYLCECLKNNSFEIIHMDRINSVMTDGTQVTDLLIIANTI